MTKKFKVLLTSLCAFILVFNFSTQFVSAKEMAKDSSSSTASSELTKGYVEISDENIGVSIRVYNEVDESNIDKEQLLDFARQSRENLAKTKSMVGIQSYTYYAPKGGTWYCTQSYNEYLKLNKIDFIPYAAIAAVLNARVKDLNWSEIKGYLVAGSLAGLNYYFPEAHSVALLNLLGSPPVIVEFMKSIQSMLNDFILTTAYDKGEGVFIQYGTLYNEFGVVGKVELLYRWTTYPIANVQDGYTGYFVQNY